MPWDRPMFPLVEIEWIDSCAEGSWATKEEAALSVAHVRSVGFLVEKTADTLTVAQSIDGDGNTAERLTVPRVTIVKESLLHPAS